MITIQCRKCGTIFDVENEMLNKVTPCAKCGQPVEVKGVIQSDAPPAPPAAAAPAPQASEQEPATRRAGLLPKILYVNGGILVALGMISFIRLLLLSFAAPFVKHGDLGGAASDFSSMFRATAFVEATTTFAIVGGMGMMLIAAGRLLHVLDNK